MSCHGSLGPPFLIEAPVGHRSLSISSFNLLIQCYYVDMYLYQLGALIQKESQADDCSSPYLSLRFRINAERLLANDLCFSIIFDKPTYRKS
jgi:hypothetical protein